MDQVSEMNPYPTTYSNMLFVTFFVVLIIICESLPNLFSNSSIYISNSRIYIVSILFLMFNSFLLVLYEICQLV